MGMPVSSQPFAGVGIGDGGGLRVPNGLVNPGGVWGWRPDRDGSGQIAAVSVHYAAKVQHQQVAIAQDPLARPVVRES